MPNLDSDDRSIDLTIRDRLVLISYFPENTSKLTAMIFQDVFGKLKLSDEERKRINLKELPNGGMQFDDKQDIVKPIFLSNSEISVLKSAIDMADKAEKINYNHVDTLNKICNLK